MVSEAEYYDGPIPPDNISPLPQRKQAAATPQAPPPKFAPVLSPAERAQQQARQSASYVAMVRVALSILNAQLLALLATLCSCGLWLYAVADPSTLRTVTAAAFSVTVLLPLIVLYWKRSD